MPVARQEHHQPPRVVDVCADDAEILALSIVRFVASGYMTGDVACWEAAHDGAERLLGADEGGRVVAAMVGVMRAIRRERSTDWRFMPATCCRVTADERDLVALLAAARRGGHGAVTSGAADLAGVAAAPALSAAVRLAAAVLDGSAHLVVPAPRGSLH